MTAGMHVRLNDNSVGSEQKNMNLWQSCFPNGYVTKQQRTYIVKNLVKHCLWKIVTETFLLFCHVKKDRENFKRN